MSHVQIFWTEFRSAFRRRLWLKLGIGALLGVAASMLGWFK